jgi:hypothetical protein
MGFDAGKSVTALNYDFSTLPIADEETQKILAEAKGTIPEPSQAALDNFQKHVREMATDPEIAALVALADDADPAAVIEAIGAMPAEKLTDVNNRMVDAIIDVCSGSPSAEQVRALPPRVRNAFIGWVSGELVGPTGPTPGSGHSLATATPNGASAT